MSEIGLAKNFVTMEQLLLWQQTATGLSLLIKLTEHNFGGNFKNLTNRQDFCVLLRSLIVHLTITFKTYKMPQISWHGGSKIAREPFLASVCFVCISASRTDQTLAKVKFGRK